MRIAFISDIHANLVALDAVLADIERVGADRIVCLGDVVSLGPQPVETLARIRELGCPCILGNHDPFHHIDPALEAIETWCRAQLSDADLQFLRSFHATLEIALDDTHTLLCVHGSPRSYDEGMLVTTPEAVIDELFADHDCAVMVCGHTHLQLLRRRGHQVVVNVGSVGMPFEAPFSGGPPRVYPWCEYAIVEWRNGALSVDLRRIPLDFDAFAATVRASTMPNPEGWLSSWAVPG